MCVCTLVASALNRAHSDRRCFGCCQLWCPHFCWRNFLLLYFYVSVATYLQINSLFLKSYECFRTASPLKMRPIGCPETSVTDMNLRFNYRDMAGHVYIRHFIEQETDSNQNSSGFQLFVSCVCFKALKSGRIRLPWCPDLNEACLVTLRMRREERV